ncbi:unnamed protein product [Candidula unifasciata]|uniref:Fanconi anemia group I protein n=1 Tax=Candidula unifasciata TaxID=100452 RepID=A0A8S3ZR61_9EUPU|nr:unnamed protein product [Candidula unifasciata]
MEGVILQLSKQGKVKEIIDLLDQQDERKVVECVTGYIMKGKHDPLPLIKEVLAASLQDNETSTQRCYGVITGIIKLLQKNEINSKSAFDIVSLLLTEIDAVQPSCLAKLAQFYVDSVKSGTFSGGKASELLPKILSLINVQEKIPKDEGDIKGSELKGHIINSLCSSRWTSAVTIQMAPVFQEIDISLEELRFVIEKIVRMFSEIDLPDQPALVFQLLRLSAKGHKRLVLESICKFYTAKDDANRGNAVMIDSADLMSDATCLTTLRQIEGTVILHITQAVKQDQELGKELIKYLKIQQQASSSKVVSPFNLSLLLSVSQLHHFEEQILEFLKSSVVKSFKDEERQKQSLWVRECYPCGVKTENLVLEAVEHSTFDWDHVVQGLVKLGFGLMDSFGPKLVFGALPETTPASGHLTPAQSACQLGRRILLKTFKAHEPVRNIILEQIFNNIVMKSTLPVGHYLDLLSDTVFSAPQLLLESSGKIQEIFVKLAQLPPKSAESLLTVIQPLLKLSPRLKDTLILVLRKAMFSRQLDSRRIGALGFLMVLKSFRVVGGLPSSQVSQPIALSQLQVDVHTGYNAASNEALCLEILGNLRRCFTQQADIRLSIYQGLYDVLHRNSQLMNPVLDMLLSQLKKYYEPDEEICPPLRMESCIITQGDQVFLSEPLAHLIGCAQQCVRKSVEIVSRMQRDDEDDDAEEEGDGEKFSQKQIQALLSSLTKRIIDAEMEDFELDKSADFSCNNSVGVKNNIYAILLLGLYDVLMEYNFESGQCSAESCSLVIQLFTKYLKLSNILKEKSSPAAGKKGKTSHFKTPISLLSLQCVLNFLQSIIDHQDASDEAGIKQLQEHKEFFLHLMSVAIQKLTQVSQKGTLDGEIPSKEKLLQKCWSLGRLFYWYFVESKESHTATDQHSKKLTVLCLEGVSLVVHIASSTGKSAVLECLLQFEKEATETKDQIKDREAKIHSHIKKFQRLFVTFLNEDKENQNWKEGSTLVSVIASLSSHLPPEGQEYQQVYAWVVKIATDHTIEDNSACKQILSTLLNLAKQTKTLPALLRSICQDIHSQFGDTDPDCEVENKTNLSVTKATHCPTAAVLTLVLNHIESDLDDVEWVIYRHKADMIAGSGTSEGSCSVEYCFSATQTETLDKAMCTRLGLLVNSFIELTHSAVKTKPCCQALLKSLTKLYNTLTSLTKHYISLYTNKTGHLGSRFEKLVTLVGRQLTQPTYSFIIYVQTVEAEQDEGQKEKKRKKPGTAATAQAGMANAMKQMKTIPNLIFAIEQLEKFLIQLSKKSKVNLMENMKLSTSRDFRINTETVTTVVEQAVSSDDESQQSDDDDDNDKNHEKEREKTPNQSLSDSDSGSGSDAENKKPAKEPPAKKKKVLLKKSN